MIPEQPGSQNGEFYNGPRQENGLPFGMAHGWVLPEEASPEENLWLRFDAAEPLPVRVLAAAPIHYYGHWYQPGRVYRLCLAKPCSLGGKVLPCPHCPKPGHVTGAEPPKAGPAQLRYIIPVELPGGAQRIWEMSAAVGRQIQQITGLQRDAAGRVTRTHELRGLRLVIRRVPPRSNGAVVVQLDPEPDPRGDIPVEVIDAAGYVAETWRRAAVKDGKAATLPFDL